MTTLTATTRDTATKLEAIRAEGAIPAVIYGAGITESIHVSVDREAFKKTWKMAGGSSAITLTADGHDYDVLIHDFQIDPRTDIVVHADFLALDKKTKIVVHVDLEFIGEAPAVKSGLGSLEKPLHQIEIEALPKDLPKSIEVDLSGLTDAHDQIHVRDIKVPAGVEIKTNMDEVIAVIAGINQEPEEPSAPIDLDSIEVEQKGKKDEEAEDAAE